MIIDTLIICNTIYHQEVQINTMKVLACDPRICKAEVEELLRIQDQPMLHSEFQTS